jgi:proteasome lid subunit RPN8/RPN11
MGIFKKDKALTKTPEWKIKRKCLDLIFECAKSSYPNEFGGLLRVDSVKKDTIIELVMLPGTISGDAHAIFKLHMLPIDFSIVGTVHSHPSYSNQPSDADINFFKKTGKVHIISAVPFDIKSWKAYDFNGEEINLTVV